MKRIFNILSRVLAGVFICAAPLTAKPLVVATVTDLASIAGYIGGDYINVDYIAPGPMDPHQVELKPSHAMKLVRADAVIRIGVNQDDWIFPLIDNSRNTRIRMGNPAHIDASHGVKIIDIPVGMVDRSLGDVHAGGNPHYMLDPRNGLVVARNLTARFSILFPEHKSHFEANLAKFEAELESKMEEWQPMVDVIKGNTIAVYHKHWGYFAEFLDVDMSIQLEPKPGIPPTPAHLRGVIEEIKSRNVPLIIQNVWHERRSAQSVARNTGAKVLVLPGQVRAVRGVNTYFDLFDYNIKKIYEALK
jgi:ABC-type Zn uptake system ZnuABC Zn-binding protein ZnuA